MLDSWWIKVYSLVTLKRPENYEAIETYMYMLKFNQKRKFYSIVFLNFKLFLLSKNIKLNY